MKYKQKMNLKPKRKLESVEIEISPGEIIIHDLCFYYTTFIVLYVGAVLTCLLSLVI